MSADAQLPGIRTDLHVACQADGTIREGKAGGDGCAERAIRINKGAGGTRRLLLLGELNIGLGLMEPFLSADPLGSSVLVVVAIARQAIANRTERSAILVVTTPQAGQGQIVPIGMAETDGAQGMQGGVDIGEDALMPFPGVAENFTDGEVGEAAAQVFKTWDGEKVVILVGWGERAGDRPVGKETIIHDVESFGLIAEVVLAVRSGSLFWVFRCIGVGTGLVRAGVVNVGGIGIAKSGETAVLKAVGSITGAAFLARLPRWAGTGSGWF